MSLPRNLTISYNSSFFLFGARGTGKTTLLREQFNKDFAIKINLLVPSEFQRYLSEPGLLSAEIAHIKNIAGSDSWILIDEVQRVPALLDLVHFHIEEQQIRFALTGSSARKLRRGAANLLAGRAFTYHLFPLTVSELGDRFSLDQALSYGTLPGLLNFSHDDDRASFLESYGQTYLHEEVWNEHLIRALPPFSRFLAVAAQMNGEILNFSKIADDVGVDWKSVRSYFSILEDTLLGFRLEPYHKSIRKRQRQSSKFYLFDCGVKRALDGTLRSSLVQGSAAYGRAFEHFLITELVRECSYRKNGYQFYYLHTGDNAEVDLVIDRPGMPTALVEIKSTTKVDERDLIHLKVLGPAIVNSRSYCLSRDSKARKVNGIEILPWREGVLELLT